MNKRGVVVVLGVGQQNVVHTGEHVYSHYVSPNFFYHHYLFFLPIYSKLYSMHNSSFQSLEFRRLLLLLLIYLKKKIIFSSKKNTSPYVLHLFPDWPFFGIFYFHWYHSLLSRYIPTVRIHYNFRFFLFFPAFSFFFVSYHGWFHSIVMNSLKYRLYIYMISYTSNIYVFSYYIFFFYIWFYMKSIWIMTSNSSAPQCRKHAWVHCATGL